VKIIIKKMIIESVLIFAMLLRPISTFREVMRTVYMMKMVRLRNYFIRNIAKNWAKNSITFIRSRPTRSLIQSDVLPAKIF